MNSTRLRPVGDNRRLAAAPSRAPGTAPRATASDGTSGTWPVTILPTKPAVAASAVMASELPIVMRIGTPTTTMRSGTSRKAPPAPTRPAATPTPAQTTIAFGRLNSTRPRKGAELLNGVPSASVGTNRSASAPSRHQPEHQEEQVVVGVLGEDGADKRGARHDQAAEQRRDRTGPFALGGGRGTPSPPPRTPAPSSPPPPS